MTEVYRLPRLRIDAELHLVGRKQRQVYLFVGDRAEKHLGPERPSDFLNASGTFIPAFERDVLVIINLENVLRVTVAAELELGADELRLLNPSASQATHERVEILFDDGTTMRGSISFVRPEGQRRIQDFLNSTGRFFPLHESGKVHLVHKNRVVLVTSLDTQR